MIQKLRITLVGALMLCVLSIGGYPTILGEPQSPAPQTEGIPIPTGKVITPAAALGAIFQDLNPGHDAAPDVRATGASGVAVSPDGKLLAILTTGYNTFYDRNGKSLPELSTEYLFLFDVTGARPKLLQVLPIRNTFLGLSWAPSSNQIFVSGGIDDAVVEFIRNGSTFVPGRTLRLGHKSWVGPDIKIWAGPDGKNCLGCTGEVSGLAVSPDGTRLLVANIMNDSVSLIDLSNGRVVAEQDLRPGIIDPKHRGESGGSYPRAVVWSSPTHAYVGSERDREIISMAISQDKIRVVRRTRVRGQPVALVANRGGSRIYAALDTTNQVAIFDTARDNLIESLDVVAPESIYANTKMLGGANTNALALMPDERTLLVSNGGENAISVVKLSDRARGVQPANHKKDADGDADRQAEPDRSAVIGLAPTGWYPTGVATSKDGATWYVVNGKSPTGPTASWCRDVDPVHNLCQPNKSVDPFTKTYLGGFYNGYDMLRAENLHLEQLERAGFLTFPAPAALELASLTKQVAHNNGFDQPEKTAADERLFSFLRDHIKHVIYIMKENRSYDQVLGDLEVGNGDPRLTLFPERISPNHHAIARNFVTLDNTLVSGEGSFQGFMWTYSAQTTDYNERSEPLIYAGRGPSDWYGYNRNISMGYSTGKERHAEFSLTPSDPDILPGTHDVNAPDGPGGAEGAGYLWDAALRQGLTVRNWGLAQPPVLSLAPGLGLAAPGVRDAYAEKVKVFYTSKASLMPYSDPYFRTFFPAYPDYWRAKEWKREFNEFVTAKSAPNLMVMWLANDHFGFFREAIDGVNTPETQMADNDYALGQIIEAVANSPFAKDTLVISIEDDAWDGSDHVDSHRTIALFAGPYVRQHAVVSARYTTVNIVKTIEEILGIGPISLNDALAAPMSDVFDPNTTNWSYKAIVPDVLRSTKLPLPPADHPYQALPTHSARYWEKAMTGQDFSGPDRINPRTFNRALWRGLKGNAPYPNK